MIFFLNKYNKSIIINKLKTMFDDKYLELLYISIIKLRARLKEIDTEAYELLDIIHNIPWLLDSKKEINKDRIKNELIDFENKYLIKNKLYSSIIK